MNIFQQIKNAVDIIDVAKIYGINVINGKNALCPFHNDTHPSMSFKEDICTCWVCNETFDCISLVSKIFHLSPIESAKKLIKDFGLGFDTKQSVSQEYIRQVNSQNELLYRFEKWEKDSFIILTDYLHLLNSWKYQYVPTKEEFINNTINEHYLEACNKIDYIEYLTDVFIYGNYKDKVCLYKTHRKEVEKIGNKIRKNRNFNVRT